MSRKEIEKRWEAEGNISLRTQYKQKVVDNEQRVGPGKEILCGQMETINGF